jgi:high-affinity Fe2+/Pb2+ permease
MPGSGPHHWYFVGKTPWIAWVLYVLLGVNTIAGLVGVPIYEHFAHRSLGFDERFIEIQFILLALIGLVFVIYRKNVRHEDRGVRRK